MRRNAYLATTFPIAALLGYALAFPIASALDRAVFGAAFGITILLSAILFVRLFRAVPGTLARTNDLKRRGWGLALSAVGMLAFSFYLQDHTLAAVVCFALVVVALVAVANLLVLVVPDDAALPSRD